MPRLKRSNSGTTGGAARRAGPARMRGRRAVLTLSETGVVRLKSLRTRLGVSQKLMSRLVSLSLRKISELENTKKKPSPQTQQRLNEIGRLQEALVEVIAPEYVAEWLETPNDAFDGLKPIEVIDRGEIDRIWQMLFFLRSGVVS